MGGDPGTRRSRLITRSALRQSRRRCFVADHRHTLGTRLRNQKPIEGVLVLDIEASGFKCMHHLDRHRLIIELSQNAFDLARNGGELRQLADPVFGRDLKQRYAADQKPVAGAEIAARATEESFGLSSSDQSSACVSSNSLNRHPARGTLSAAVEKTILKIELHSARHCTEERLLLERRFTNKTDDRLLVARNNDLLAGEHTLDQARRCVLAS